ncbi:hypothetical protein [Sorangium sp. So ce1024]|uniref:hypothetical protein n=1 Tax=Sorangium sp. So ce1024 TaxID=3133327 RepID=UPI003F103F20
MSPVPDHLVPVIRRVRAAPVQDPPAPWQRRAAYAVGGLTDVGFGRGSDLLLVISHSGRGVFDCLAGARVARDASVPEAGEDEWQDTSELEAEGIGPLAGQTVRTAGLFGGALAHSTRDGWTVERIALDWPEESLLLVPPGAFIYETRPGRSAEFTKVAVQIAPRAWGFSPTGKSLILATSSDVTIFSRTG